VAATAGSVALEASREARHAIMRHDAQDGDWSRLRDESVPVPCQYSVRPALTLWARAVTMAVDPMVRKIVAVWFIALIVLPFTEPWPTCPLRRSDAGVARRTESPTYEGRIEASVPPAPPDVVNPSTLLPPPREPKGILRVSGPPSLASSSVVGLPAFIREVLPHHCANCSRPVALPALTPTLRI
jgi:hypothetical protein